MSAVVDQVAPAAQGAQGAQGGPTAPVPPATPATPAAAQPAADGSLGGLIDEPAALAWYRRPLWWTVLGLVLLCGVGLGIWRSRQAAMAMPSYSLQRVGRGNLILTVTANGTIQPTRSISIGSELSGTVRQVNVDVNDAVRKGQVLAVLDTAKLQDQVLRSRALLAAARAGVVQSVATRAEAGAGLARLEEVARISGGQVPSLAELDAARAAWARAVGAEASARAGVSEAQAAASTDQITLSKASITAPADGMVLTRAVDPGNAVAASLQAVTLFTVAEDLAKVRLWVYVDEADVGAVQPGQAATFTVSAYPTRHFPARITRVGFGSTITDNVVTYLTYLDVENADLSLRPGMTATASITAAQRHDVLLVPNTALRFTPSSAAAGAPGEGGLLSSMTPRMPSSTTRRSAATGASTAAAKQVWVLPGEGGAKDAGASGEAASETATGAPMAVAVTPGISDGHMTEILGGDLKAGMRVVTGQKVAVSK